MPVRIHPYCRLIFRVQPRADFCWALKLAAQSIPQRSALPFDLCPRGVLWIPCVAVYASPIMPRKIEARNLFLIESSPRPMFG